MGTSLGVSDRSRLITLAPSRHSPKISSAGHVPLEKGARELSHNPSPRIQSIGRAAAGILAFVWAGQAGPAWAESIIKRPGDHPDYSVELEPHLVVQHSASPAWNDTGFGVGLRANVVILDGPIKSINNSMAIGFGVDWAHFDDACWDWYYHDNRDRRGYYYDDHCKANSLWFPVVLQWNFWLTDVISVFGEPGLAISHDWWEGYYDPGAAPRDYDHTSFHFLVLWGGARFQFSDRVNATVRIGWPSLTAGIGFLI